jgi:hypothetical protein
MSQDELSTFMLGSLSEEELASLKQEQEQYNQQAASQYTCQAGDDEATHTQCGTAGLPATPQSSYGYTLLLPATQLQQQQSVGHHWGAQEAAGDHLLGYSCAPESGSTASPPCTGLYSTWWPSMLLMAPTSHDEQLPLNSSSSSYLGTQEDTPLHLLSSALLQMLEQ